jgi:branched-subunit amino acid aminotransferase/4-amino-4-deoxychorismate lyase
MSDTGAPYAYLNGRILPQSEAAISPLDIGLLRGYAVFDLLRTVGGRPFMLAEHLQRLRSSAGALGLKVPATDAQIASAIDELLDRNQHQESIVRLVLTGGASPDGMSFDPETPTFFILTHELHEPPAELYARGGELRTFEHTREVPEAKTTNYLTMLREREATGRAGSLDLLYHDGARVFEAASASVYFVREGLIFAPAEGVLRGTVGSLLLELAQPDFEVVRGEISLGDALGADEAFLTSTTRGVLPIVRIDGKPVGDGCVGPVTRELMARWSKALEQG